MDAKEQLDVLKRIKSIAETGLVHAEGGYDKERYEELREISLKLMSEMSGQPLAKLDGFFLPQ